MRKQLNQTTIDTWVNQTIKEVEELEAIRRNDFFDEFDINITGRADKMVVIKNILNRRVAKAGKPICGSHFGLINPIKLKVFVRSTSII